MSLKSFLLGFLTQTSYVCKSERGGERCGKIILAYFKPTECPRCKAPSSYLEESPTKVHPIKRRSV